MNAAFAVPQTRRAFPVCELDGKKYHCWGRRSKEWYHFALPDLERLVRPGRWTHRRTTKHRFRRVHLNMSLCST